MKTLSPRKLHLQVKELLWKEIIHGEYSSCEMLPPEPELCSRLGVSRSTVRHAVTTLEQEGYLRRRQGIGTIIDRNVCSIRSRIDQKIEYSELLARIGHTPEVRFIEANEEPASEEFARKLQIEPGELLLNITKLWLADGQPAILNTDSIPLRFFIKPYDEEAQKMDIFTVLKEYCNLESIYQIAELVPTCLNEELEAYFGPGEKTPIVAFTGVGYDQDGQPIIVNKEKYAPGFLTFTLLRPVI